MKISILGSTGSIGRQAAEVIQKMPDFFEVVSLCGGSNIEELTKQIKLLNPKNVCVKTEENALKLASNYGKINTLTPVAGDKVEIENEAITKIYERINFIKRPKIAVYFRLFMIIDYCCCLNYFCCYHFDYCYYFEQCC